MCHPGVRLMTGCKIDAANISTLSFWTHIPSPVLRGKSWIKIEIWLGRTSNHPTDYFRAEKNEPPVADAFRSGERRDINLTITHKNQDDPPRSQYQSTESIHWHHKSPQAMVTPEQMALWWDLNLAAIKWLRTEKSFSWNRRCRRRHQHWNLFFLFFCLCRRRKKREKRRPRPTKRLLTTTTGIGAGQSQQV